MTRSHFSKRPRTLAGQGWLAAIGVICLMVSGCGDTQIPLQTGYGKSTGRSHSKSVNGTKVLRGMIESTGVLVDRYDKLSPKIENYETIIWFPDDRHPPPAQVIARLESWLASGWSRELILVGRDFDAEIGFWEAQIAHQQNSPDKPQYQRELANALTRQDQARELEKFQFGPVPATPTSSTQSCDWYVQKRMGDHRATNISGNFTELADTNNVDVRYNWLLQPPSGPSHGYTIEELLKVDGEVFAFSLNRSEWGDGKITVVSNGSFLLNYSLVNEQNRVLASNVVESSQYYGRTLLLESSSSPLIRNSDYETHNQWAWITKPPLRYIVPHFLFWGILFSFVFFPIFGRPKRLAKKATGEFCDHINAVGRLLSRSKSKSEAKAWIENYRQGVSTRSRPPRE